MVYGIAFCSLSDIEVLKKLGCADSKQLTEQTREIIFDDINQKEYANTTVGYVEYEVHVIQCFHYGNMQVGS